MQQILTGSIFVADIERMITGLSDYYDFQIRALLDAFEIIMEEPEISDMRAICKILTTESKRIQTELGNQVAKLNGNLVELRSITEAKKYVIEAQEFIPLIETINTTLFPAINYKKLPYLYHHSEPTP
jgi:hypothetical protein